MLQEVAENQLAFAPRVAGVDDARNVLAFDQAKQHVEALLTPLNRRQVEMRRNDWKVLEGPLAFLHLVVLWHRELEQVADRRREHVVIAFEVIALARETAEGAR